VKMRSPFYEKIDDINTKSTLQNLKIFISH
jgi:hypothetical protein